MAKVNVTMPDDLLRQIDEVARQDYTSRSDVIRQAVLFYLRSTGATLSPNDVEALLKAMRSRQLKAYLNKTVRGFESRGEVSYNR